MQQPTIYDVARLAGVAPSTVSRTFGRPDRVGAATRERVQAAADELGYVPNPHARALQTGRHKTIAMVISDIANPHFFELIRGAEQRAKAAENTLVIVNAEESPTIERDQVRGLSRSVDGFILAASRLPDQELRDLSAQHHVVLVDRELDSIPSVVMDTAAGCRQILEHLESLGHREFTYCAGPPGSWMGAARWAALRTGAEEHGLRARRVGPYTPTVANGGVAADGALRSGTTALVAHNDLLAIGIMRRLADRGVRVPEDISVIGFDDIFAAELVQPPLTTLGGPDAHAGRLAVEMLLELLKGPRGGSSRDDAEPLHHQRLPTSLVLRDSSGPAKG
ncbi:LacI family DNA-binding transcriptional regulator [Aeromicrobium sp. IC_218]|uniref:LacI family DNA-binding transcriptional regulator n=1 Tax=Aeromicrobium sp. IC_218 TaxID=2545468 RepID=UPI00103A1177|nr:LacI family DNA-binding transcriptional regulator [Aeromicrobium sp. IC_218]TCJ00797.1 LacI family transcriptional regulator [Aeromicrobium sp. IC_218]